MPERGVMLDARNLRTPGGAIFVAPTPALAVAVAAEWNASGRGDRTPQACR
ncbi:MAG: ATP12 family protein [Hyphomonadaceae bacterium]